MLLEANMKRKDTLYKVMVCLSVRPSKAKNTKNMNVYFLGKLFAYPMTVAVIKQRVLTPFSYLRPLLFEA